MFRNKEYNESLIIDDISKVVPLNEDGSIKDPAVVDQFDAQPFLLGDNGFQRNIMSQIMASESQQLREALISKLGDLSKTEGFDKSVPASDVLKAVIPRRCQTASSMRDWLSENDKSIGDYVDSLKKQYDEIQAKNNIKFNETDVSHETE